MDKRKKLVALLAGIMAAIMLLTIVLSLLGSTVNAASSSELKEQLDDLRAEYAQGQSKLDALEKQSDDLEYSIMAYGVAEFMDCNGLDSVALRKELINRDSFWISYCYVAAWKDAYGKRD